MILRGLLAAVAATALLSACGGGETPAGRQPPAAFQAAIHKALAREAPAAMTAAAVAGAPGVGEPDELDAANQLMDFAEGAYPAYFKGRSPTRHFDGYLYRHYAETGVHLGVRGGDVFVLGGPFGGTPLRVGALTEFVTPVPPVPAGLCSNPAANQDRAVAVAPRVGKNAAATLAGCSGAIASPRWTQRDGPAVELLSDKSQTISFDPPSAGRYSFEVSYVDDNGTARQEFLSMDVADRALPLPQLTLRASHSVRAGGKVSVRAWPLHDPADGVRSISWQQIEGPAVTLDTRDPHVAIFTAPAVTRDTLIRLRATLITNQGFIDRDEVMVLVENHRQAPRSEVDALWNGDHLSRVYPYRAGGRYAADLMPCVYDSGQIAVGPRFNLCPLSRLPFLAQETGGAIPTVEQVMDRVLVSHDWVGRNFEAWLRSHDASGDMRRMMMSVTAIVLGTGVRPSFYYVATGAIYLDAENFWLTPAERDTANEVPDFRSEFSNALAFRSLWRYVKDNRSIFGFFDPRQRVTRSLDDLHADAAWLLYHELGHALDFLPPGEYHLLDPRIGSWANIAPRHVNAQLTSDLIASLFPLTSTVMSRLGDVMFRGFAADDEQKAYTAEQVGATFAADLATDDYNYSSVREDTAMTLEEFLMAHRQGVRRDVAFSDRAPDPNATSSSSIVRWGQRGRIGEPTIRPRAQAIVQRLVPWVDAGEVDRLPAPLHMRSGESWRDNLIQPAALGRVRPLAADRSPLHVRQFQRELQRMSHHRHAGARPLPPLPPGMVADPAARFGR